MNKKSIAILLLAALFIAAIPTAFTLAADSAQTPENRKTACGLDAIKAQERDQLRDRECLTGTSVDCNANTAQERIQQRSQEMGMFPPQAGTYCDSSYDCQGLMLQLRGMLQANNQKGFGYVK